MYRGETAYSLITHCGSPVNFLKSPCYRNLQAKFLNMLSKLYGFLNGHQIYFFFPYQMNFNRRKFFGSGFIKLSPVLI